MSIALTNLATGAMDGEEMDYHSDLVLFVRHLENGQNRYSYRDRCLFSTGILRKPTQDGESLLTPCFKTTIWKVLLAQSLSLP